MLKIWSKKCASSLNVQNSYSEIVHILQIPYLYQRQWNRFSKEWSLFIKKYKMKNENSWLLNIVLFLYTITLNATYIRKHKYLIKKNISITVVHKKWVTVIAVKKIEHLCFFMLTFEK